MPKISQTTKLVRARSVVAGIGKRFPAGKRYVVGGNAVSPKQMIALYQEHLDALEAIRVARVALTVAVARERAIARRVTRFTATLRNAVYTLFGNEPTVVADFGWTMPKKPGPKTVAAKLAGAEKVRATRKARGTMGKRQREKIRG